METYSILGSNALFAIHWGECNAKTIETYFYCIYHAMLTAHRAHGEHFGFLFSFLLCFVFRLITVKYAPFTDLSFFVLPNAKLFTVNNAYVSSWGLFCCANMWNILKTKNVNLWCFDWMRLKEPSSWLTFVVIYRRSSPEDTFSTFNI